jgi:hypothetical protein
VIVGIVQLVVDEGVVGLGEGERGVDWEEVNRSVEGDGVLFDFVVEGDFEVEVGHLLQMRVGEMGEGEMGM